MKYTLIAPRNGYDKNYEVAQELMSTFEFSGVFSEALLNKVQRILIQTIESVSYDDSQNPRDFNCKNGKGTKQEYIQEKLEEFKSIFDTYCIFSDKFRISCMSLFYTLMRTDLK